MLDAIREFLKAPVPTWLFLVIAFILWGYCSSIRRTVTHSARGLENWLQGK
jgi:hypothetical protein